MLCSLSDYRRYTRDTASVDDDAVAALMDAQSEAEEFCKRRFEQSTRTETLRIYRDGRVYPSAYPIASVETGGRIDGAAVVVGLSFAGHEFVDPRPWSDSSFVPECTVTYLGGYSPEDMPVRLKRAVAKMAYGGMNSTALVGVPGGLTSISMGDLSMSSKNGLSGFVTIDDAIAKELRPYRRRTAA